MHCLVVKETSGAELLTIHNVVYMLTLMKHLRASITEGRFPEFVRKFIADMFPSADVPGWVVDALKAAGVDLGEK